MPRALGPLLAALLLAPTAHAANRDTFPLGNQAALTAGAVTATVTDGGALFYNPAGIASHRRQRFSLNGSATMLILRPRDEVVVTNIDSADSTASTDVQLISAPTAGTFSLPLARNLSASVGSFVRVRDNAGQDIEVRGLVPGTDIPAVATVDLTGYQDELLFAGGLGWQPTAWLRVGGALFGAVEKEERVGRTLVSVGDVLVLNGENFRTPSGRGGGVLNEEIEQSTTRVGLEGTLGIQLHPFSGLRIGLLVRTHRFGVYEGGEKRTTRTRFWGPQERQVTSSWTGEPQSEELTVLEAPTVDGPGVQGSCPEERNPIVCVTDDEGDGLVFRVVGAPRVAFGLAWEGRRWSISADVDYAFGLDARGLKEQQNPILNVRVGATGRVNDLLWLGGGLFTDRTGREPAESVLDDHMDWYGGNVGIWMRTPVSLRPDERAEDIVFSSVIALRYAAGVGGVGQAQITVGEVGAAFEEHSVTARPSVFHEVALHIGSSLEF